MTYNYGEMMLKTLHIAYLPCSNLLHLLSGAGGLRRGVVALLADPLVKSKKRKQIKSIGIPICESLRARGPRGPWSFSLF